MAQGTLDPPETREFPLSDGGTLLRPGETVWRIARARRAAVLIDGAAFFRAVREAMLRAQRSIFIVGWDIDSRCRLVGENCTPDDRMPVTMAAFLSALARDRPDLTVHLLLWDYSIVYALERELFPTLSLQWATPQQVRLCLDNELPLGSAHHQKIILVDDTVAFSGGLDLTIRRWDTTEHALDNPHRVDPFGNPYRPFHDVQAIVDGEAAKALAELVRERWARANCDAVAAIAPTGDPWPESVAPDFHDIAVGIARTLPRHDEEPEVREVERLFIDSIAEARAEIYIENQFLTCTAVAERLARHLAANPAIETLMVGPQSYDSWIETHTMRHGRIRFMRMLESNGVAERARLVYPEVRAGDRMTDTMIHSKVCVIDDHWLRVGSANLNNRSMGADTECDLIFEASTPAHRARIRQIRNRLLGEHCGVGADEVAASLVQTGSLLETARLLSRNGHRLQPVDDGEEAATEITTAIEEIADPPHALPVEIARAAKGRWFAALDAPALLKIALATCVVIVLALVWHATPLSALADPEVTRRALAQTVDTAWAPLIVIGVFVVAGLVAFPVTVLIAVTAATFGPALGFAYAGAGALASALATYGLGQWLGKDLLNSLLGPRLDRIRRRIVNQGVIAVAAIRLVPVAPFTLVNLAAGASAVRLYDYAAGTILGMAPGLLVMSALGHQVFRILTAPTAGNVALLGAAIVAWVALSVGVQMLVSWLRRR